ncbi:MAG: helix-turn-helix transcriptional regulator [Acidobacteriota bacterium]
MFSADLKRGSMEMLILAVLDGPPRHGYEIGKSLEARSEGRLEFKASTLYSVLYRMEKKRWIKGRWVEKEGERRRCRYSLTSDGREELAKQRSAWRSFVETVDLVVGGSHA